MKSLRIFTVAFATLLLISATSYATQQSGEQKKKKPPSLTMDDISAPKSSTTKDSGKEAGKTEAGEAKDTEKGDTAKAKETEGQKTSPEELAWRQVVASARDQVKSLKRESEELELNMTEARNGLNAPGLSVDAHNRILADYETAQNRLDDLKKQLREAETNLNKLLDDGREKNYSEKQQEIIPETSKGKPNTEHYRTQYATLTEKLAEAEREVSLYENRYRDANMKIGSTGDDFTRARLQQDLDDATTKLAEANDKRDKAKIDIESLREEARRAGVDPGIFR